MRTKEIVKTYEPLRGGVILHIKYYNAAILSRVEELMDYIFLSKKIAICSPKAVLIFKESLMDKIESEK